MNPSIRYRQSYGQINPPQQYINYQKNVLSPSKINNISTSSSNPGINNKNINPPSSYKNTVPSYNNCSSIQKQPILSRHSSNNADTKTYQLNEIYQQNDFSKSYRLQNINHNEMKSQQIYVSKHSSQNYQNKNLYKTSEIIKAESETSSANDFFNELAEEKQSQQKGVHQQRSPGQYTNNRGQIKSKNVIPTKTQQSNSHQHHQKIISYPNIQKRNQSGCQNCVALQKQISQMLVFMREQLQIGTKQYTQKISKIMIQQAKEIKDLRKTLINNEKNVIRIQRSVLNPQMLIARQNSFSPNKSTMMRKQRQNSKLSLTKSNHSVSPNHATNKQKLNMVSKQMSPAKAGILRKYSQNDQFLQTSQKSTSTIHNNNSNNHNQYHQQLGSENIIQQLVKKIKTLQQKIQATYKFQQQRKDKVYAMNKRIQILQKGFINFFSGKLQKLKTSINTFMNKQDEKVNQLYKQIKNINTRIVTTKSNNSAQLVYSPPLIACQPSSQIHNSNQPQFNINKIAIKLKNFYSEIQDLKQNYQNLHTKQFKYDNYQIDDLNRMLEDLNKTVYNLQKARHTIGTKIYEHQQKLSRIINLKERELSQHSDHSRKQQAIQKSTTLNRNKSMELSNTKYQNSYQHHSTHYGNHKPSTSSQQQINLSSSSTNKNIIKNQSFYTTANSKNNLKPLQNQSTKNNQKTPSLSFINNFNKQIPNNIKISNNTKNNYQNIQSQSQFKGFSGQSSQLSHYGGQYSTYNQRSSNLEKHPNQQSGLYHQKNRQLHHQQQSFQRSSSSEGQQQNYQNQQYDRDQQQQQDQDQFFYPVDLNSNNNRLGEYFQNTSNNYAQQKQYPPTGTINRFMEVIQYRENKPLKIEIDQTGYIKSAENGMYIVDRNMDGFDLNKNELEWLKSRGIVIIQH